jgi:hypothetical protein
MLYCGGVVMSKGGWAISEKMVDVISRLIPNGGKILEFGSGQGTKWLCKAGYDMYSVEEDISFCHRHHDNYCYAPIVDKWYDVDKVSKFLENKTFDAMLIDGPAYGQRLRLLEAGIDFDKFPVIIVDDVDRVEDRELFDTLSENKRHELTETYGVIFND